MNLPLLESQFTSTLHLHRPTLDLSSTLSLTSRTKTKESKATREKIDGNV
jgi:hypothetical protein